MTRKIIVYFTIMILSSGCLRKSHIYIDHSHLQNMEDVTDTIELAETKTVSIYCTGELKPDWSNIDRKYIGQDDDIEIFFRQLDNSIKKITFKAAEIKGDTLIAETDQVKCKRTFDKQLRKYTALISIPNSLVLDKVLPGHSFDFDVAIGDNDDGIKQKSKLAWAAQHDPLFTNQLSGKLVLANSQTISRGKTTAYATRISQPLTDMVQCPRYAIDNIVAGQINDEADFSGSYRAGWDEKNIYLSFEVNDSKEGRFRKENLTKDDNFVDKGWIEDLKGKKIWQMTLTHSKAAGGALKNQYCDTVLTLNPGKYIVKYSTDESHSWDKWDAPAPKVKFWGIRITEKDIKK